MKQIRIGLAGIGTVGSGVARILQHNHDLIAGRSRLDLRLVAVLDKDFSGKESLLPAGCLPTTDVDTFFKADLDIVIELIGGTTFARDLTMRALRSDIPVVTANKALLALHGRELISLCSDTKAHLRFEAAVAGAIPIIQTIDEALIQNRITKVDAILNGTSNYILTRMAEDRLDYNEALREAQRLGFAEADPSLDVNGTDAAHKITILTNLCFGSYVPFDRVSVQGIGDIELIDMDMARQMGYTIKSLGIAKLLNGSIEARVQPVMIPRSHPLANIRLENNAIFYDTDFSGPQSLFGKGAGSLPTASAVISDILKIARHAPMTRFHTTETVPIVHTGRIRSRFYLRLMTEDRPGILAVIADILGKNQISIASVIQPETDKEIVPLTMTTHESQKSDMDRALHEIRSKAPLHGKTVLLHIED